MESQPTSTREEEGGEFEGGEGRERVMRQERKEGGGIWR